ATGPSASASSAPVTVIVCGTFQFAAVNATAAGAAVPSLGSLEATGMTTAAVGWLFKTTVNVAAPPASVVARPATGVTSMPAASSSVFTTATSAGSIAA